MENINVLSNTLRELYELLSYEDGATLTEESDEVDGFRVIANVSGNHSRWMELYTLIIRRVTDDQLFACDYQFGLTEMQPHEFPWEDGEFVECRPVRAKTRVITKTITSYVAI